MFVLSGVNCPVITPSMGGRVNKLNKNQSVINVSCPTPEPVLVND
jgi:hypothetical protein